MLRVFILKPKEHKKFYKQNQQIKFKQIQGRKQQGLLTTDLTQRMGQAHWHLF